MTAADEAQAARDAVGHHADNLRSVLARLSRTRADPLAKEAGMALAAEAVETLQALAQRGHAALDEAQARRDQLDGARTIARGRPT